MTDLGNMVAEAIAAAGVKRCYTVPAEFVWLLNAIEAHPALSLIGVRHKSSAAFMAEADAKLTDAPTVLLSGRSPGATNASNGVHSALDSSTPMLVLLSDTDVRHARRDTFQKLDLMAFYAPITKACFRATPEDSLPELVAHALRLAVSGRPGPVMVTVPQDLPQAVSAWTPRPLGGIAPPSLPPESQLDEIAQLLNEASRPVIIAGGGARRCRDDLVRVAERFSLGVYSAFRRQDVFPNDHPLYLGHLGMPAPRGTLAALAEADLVFAVGTRLSQTTTQFFKLPRPTASSRPDRHRPLAHRRLASGHGRCRRGGRGGASGIGRTLGPCNITRLEQRDHSAYLQTVEVPQDRGSRGIDPAQVVKAMTETLPADTIVTNDAGAFAGYVHQHWMFRHPISQAGTSTGTMGYAVPAAVAAKLAHPERCVVATVGDGGFLMNGQEIETALRYGAPVIVVIFNNHHLLAVAPGADYPYNRIVDVDFAAYARAFGALGLMVRDTAELAGAFRTALATDRVCVIDVKTDPQIFPTFVETSV